RRRPASGRALRAGHRAGGGRGGRRRRGAGRPGADRRRRCVGTGVARPHPGGAGSTGSSSTRESRGNRGGRGVRRSAGGCSEPVALSDRGRRTVIAMAERALPPPRAEEVSDGVYAYIQDDGSWWINNTGFIIGPR